MNLKKETSEGLFGGIVLNSRMSRSIVSNISKMSRIFFILNHNFL